LGRDEDLREGVLQPLLAGLFAQLLGDLLLEVRIGVDDVPLVPGIGGLRRGVGHGFGLSYWPIARMWRDANASPVSTTKKNTAAMVTMMKTITEVIQVSLRLGHTILRRSAFTWLTNCGMEVRFFGADASAATAAPAMAGWAVWGRRPGVLALAMRLSRTMNPVAAR